ncbi:acyl carrier protein, partial [Streptomyces harbinensis]
ADTLIARQERPAPEATAAGGPLEAELLELWSGVLGRTDLSAERSLLECGAHSLNVLVAMTTIEERYGAHVPLLDFFRTPTVRALAALIEAGR